MRVPMVVTLLLVLPTLTLPAADPDRTVKLDGYAEYRRDGQLIVDGQRVRADDSTRFKGSRGSIDQVRLGNEVRVQGMRLPDGAVLAAKVDTRENGMAFLEREVRSASDEAEMAWMDARMMFEEQEDGSRVRVGRILDSGPRVARAERVLERLLPPYVDRANLRVRVVENKDWNAAAMGNGSVWVYSGLMDQFSDDELAVVMGHELAHYTHEHSRRQAKRDLIGQLFLAGALVGVQAIDNDKARTVTSIGAALASLALASNYSRDQEDQADRVGLRYMHEAGYDVRSSPEMWQRFQEKYGNGDAVTTFLFGSHSRPSDRIRNVQREITTNYN